ncbi:uncharacterized protein Z518_05537 [Rhinocladiella mackenziei CBS 650.93]|uniref:Rhinocladiella mackenziei CBS 650.93 unplaced genomic scaffold supercont1.4, whole genome shotgun sequence n=1 Tax=Rhinocladiella mackenziei CBS 650.93 TaxID=1442369 RepID=A0A0D2FR38_9EURO|nr:uncharacterized protein Z518_05537 [Rhinocladiella mackenziei CBS 650.93]KIX04667.1 hypothetical protein Z518_05537 [Rhinocladiella mackenziei CBS 650.93]
MAPAPYTAEPGNWFLRGVQSAIFYYVSFTPCLQFQHKRQRRREAKAQAEIITTQPGTVRQPGPFQTNETWAEELMLGPGPPKGWKGDKLLQKLQKKVTKQPHRLDEAPTSPEIPNLQVQPTTSSTRSSTQPTETSTRRPSSDTNTVASEADASGENASRGSQTRPTRERRLSNAMENIKDSLRSTLHPEKWNWKRYDREDEILWGFSERMTRMWNRATSVAHHDEGGERDGRRTSTSRRRRAGTNDSDQYDYHRARHPEVNDLHPPIVSQLPATRDEAAWMILPPPSAAVMAGKKRPGAEVEMRWPLCVIGRPPKSPGPETSFGKTLSAEHIDEDEVEISDEEVEDESGRESQEAEDSPTPKRIKRLSDPIIKRPLPTYPRSMAGELFVPKRRDSWQFHYVIPSNQTMQ